MTTKTIKNEETLTALRDALKPGDTVYTILRHTSRSGMMRHISVIQIRADGDIRDWSLATARVLEWPETRKNDFAVKVSGCGMDMGFHLVYELSRTLFEDGYALKQRWL